VCVGGAQRARERADYISFNSFRPPQPVRPSIRGPRRRPESWPGSSVSPSNLGFSPSPTPPRSLPNFPPSPRPPGLGPYTLFSSRSMALLPTIQTLNNPSCHAEKAPFGRLSFFPTNLLIPTVIELHSRTCGLCDPLIKNQVCHASAVCACVQNESTCQESIHRAACTSAMHARIFQS
jgi:hypothetical protein